MWIGDSLSARPAKTFMSIGAPFHTHICPDAVIGLEENQALLDKWIAELSLSGSLQTEAEKLQGPYLFIGIKKKGSETKKEKMRKDIQRALAHILPKSCDKYCGKKGGGTGWNCIYPAGLKVAQERPIFKVSSPGSTAKATQTSIYYPETKTGKLA